MATITYASAIARFAKDISSKLSLPKVTSVTVRNIVTTEEGDKNLDTVFTLPAVQEPTEAVLTADIKTFLTETGYFKNADFASTVPLTYDQTISLFYALSYFTEKALHYKPTSPDGTKYINYVRPLGTDYVPLKTSYNPPTEKFITKNKMDDLYNKLKTGDLLTTSGRDINAAISIVSSSSSSSCSSSCSSSSSSSCSSSSSSSSSLFIAYFNIG